MQLQWEPLFATKIPDVFINDQGNTDRRFLKIKPSQQLLFTALAPFSLEPTVRSYSLASLGYMSV